MLIRKSRMTPKEQRELENAAAKEAKNRSDLEFIALMTDVDIWDEEEEHEQGR